MKKLPVIVKCMCFGSLLALLVGMRMNEVRAVSAATTIEQKGTTPISGSASSTLAGTNALLGTWPTSYFGKTTISRDNIYECCGNSASLALGENTAADRTRKASISFHNAGIAEGTLALAADNSPRRLETLDNQNYGLSLEVAGVVMARQGAPACGGRPEGFSFTGDGCQDTGMFSLGDGDLRFYSNQVTRMYIDAGGNVCIGKCQ